VRSALPPHHLNRSLRLAVALLAGIVSVAAFLPEGWAPLGLLGFVALLYLWAREPSPRVAALLGFAFGAGLFGAGVSWIYISLSRFGGMPAPLAAFATLLFCAYLAAYPAAVGWLQARLGGPQMLRIALVTPALWTLGEWLREELFTGFPWLAIGYATPGTPLEGFVPLSGGYAAGFVLLACCGLAVCALLAEVGKRGALVSLALLAALLAGGYALRMPQWTQAAGAPVTVALLQGNIPQDLKFDPARYAETLDTYARLAETGDARLTVMPETALPRLLENVSPEFTARLARAAQKNGGDLLLGVPLSVATAHPREPGRAYYNSAVTLGTSPAQRYDKRHLVPFGEFIPPGFRWVLGILSIPLSDFSRGAEQQAPLSIAGLRVSPNICYEDAFGAEMRRALPEANLLVNISNVAWFGDSLAPAQHLQIARLRALEAGRMHLTATNTGITAAIDRDGRVLARLPQFVAGRLEVGALAYEGATPYVRLGDAPALCFAALVVFAALAVARRRANR
jgi:apolipoprotein N-acyltransferase